MARRCKLRKGNSININLENETENNVNQNFQETQELYQNQASNFQGNTSQKTMRYHYEGHFIFSPNRIYENGRFMEKPNFDVDFISFFDILDDLKKDCGFDVIKGDKFYYLKADKSLSDLDALIEVKDDTDVKNMMDSYKKFPSKPIDIYTLFRDYNILPNGLGDELPAVTVDHTSNQLQNPNATAATGSNIIKRKTRGPTRCLKITQLENGQKLPVEFDEDDQAIGDNATAFVWFLGQIIRSVSCCPLQVKQWNKITDDKLDLMWSTILVRKFILNYIHYKMIIIFLVLLSIIIFISYFFAKRKVHF
ncbi:uncharacterized protein LOC122723740 [Manihot esculenta]|uniref:uncharacterized protein LOC122723740 n=1 Tax=Manihot esculenta TaxID=3983 RepID=UPI001CC3967B|nr:uncharacterized protein LOC122723740 [Manihot esculenta]